jgi:hypothetical protein
MAMEMAMAKRGGWGMKAEAYSEARKRIGSHREAAELLGISEQTSRNWAVRGADARAEMQIRLIIYLGLEKVRDILFERRGMSDG